MSTVAVPSPPRPRSPSAPGPTRSSTRSATIPAAAYVERFWLGILGPSTTWLLRRLAAGLEASPRASTSAWPTPPGPSASATGRPPLAVRARARPRAASSTSPSCTATAMLAVRRKLPPLNRRQVVRLPDRAAGRAPAVAGRAAAHAARRAAPRRARRLALSLLELGEDVEATERQLHRWKFHPALCREAAAWAWDRHRQAHAASHADPPDDAA